MHVHCAFKETLLVLALSRLQATIDFRSYILYIFANILQFFCFFFCFFFFCCFLLFFFLCVCLQSLNSDMTTDARSGFSLISKTEWQTMLIQMRRLVMSRLIWNYTVCTFAQVSVLVCRIEMVKFKWSIHGICLAVVPLNHLNQATEW